MLERALCTSRSKQQGWQSTQQRPTTITNLQKKTGARKRLVVVVVVVHASLFHVAPSGVRVCASVYPHVYAQKINPKLYNGTEDADDDVVVVVETARGFNFMRPFTEARLAPAHVDNIQLFRHKTPRRGFATCPCIYPIE